MSIASLRRAAILRAVTHANSAFFRKPLPDRIALYFHSIEQEFIEQFRALFAWLSSRDYRFCSAREYVAEGGAQKRAFVSFDDNYVAWHEQLALFAEHGVQCTFYTNTLPMRDRSSAADQEAFFNRIGYRHKRVPLSSSELREIAAAGHTIACHTHSHRKLSDISADEGRLEMLRSKEILEDIVGVPVEDFSYPFGMPRYFPSDLRTYAHEIGFARIAEAMPCMLYSAPSPSSIHRQGWRFSDSLEKNLHHAQIDGRLFVKLFGRSPIG